MDWQRFLTQHNIEFRQEGQFNISVRCPMCGEADQSKNMSISTRGRGWHCWRAAPHAGKNNARLIQALLRCDWEQAQLYAGKEPKPSAADEDVHDTVAALLGAERRAPAPRNLALPKSFKVMTNGSVFSRPFWAYLHDRGYSNDEIVGLTKTYDLRYATQGNFSYRIVIPIYDGSSKLMTWTARTIVEDEKLRYKTLSVERSDYEDNVALAPPGDLLLGLPLLWSCDRPRALVICEGPFDAFRITASGASRGVYGTCLFGLRLSDAQVFLLEELARRRFPQMWLLQDPDAELLRFGVLQRLASVRCRAAKVPDGVKDPGDLSSDAAGVLVDQLLTA